MLFRPSTPSGNKHRTPPPSSRKIRQQFHNCVLAELPNGEYDFSPIRHFLFYYTQKRFPVSVADRVISSLSTTR